MKEYRLFFMVFFDLSVFYIYIIIVLTTQFDALNPSFNSLHSHSNIDRIELKSYDEYTFR